MPTRSRPDRSTGHVCAWMGDGAANDAVHAIAAVPNSGAALANDVTGGHSGEPPAAAVRGSSTAMPAAARNAATLAALADATAGGGA